MLACNSELKVSVAQLQKAVLELEAQNDQLEQDRFFLNESLEKLESEHQKVRGWGLTSILHAI